MADAHATQAAQGAGTFLNSSLVSVPIDLLLTVPRLARRAGSVAFLFDGFFGKMLHPGSVIAQPTSSDAFNSTITSAAAAAGSFVQSETAAATTSNSTDLSYTGIFTLRNIRSLSSIANYVMSYWALTTFIVAILLNRTQVYASSRVPLRLRWYVRIGIYILPILALVRETLTILRALRCQTSPGWPQLRHGDPQKVLSMDFGGEGGFLYAMSSTALFWEDDTVSCGAVSMADNEKDMRQLSGSMSFLWPLFLNLCFSQFIETLACALQGRQPQPETGLTIFEHSLAFAEAETMITRPLDAAAASVAQESTTKGESRQSINVSRLAVLKILNVPSEILLFSLISSLSHLSSNLLAAIGIRDRFRLINTAVSGLSYMAAFVWSARRMSLTSTADFGLLRFPTVCLVGFIPHLIILLGTLACAAIYGLALLLTALSPPAGTCATRSLRERLSWAYQNLQANIHLSSGSPITINWRDDFYTTLLKAGFTILTAASEAVYLNEGTQVQLGEMTWLEEKRINELAARRIMLRRTLDLIPPEIRNDLATNSILNCVEAEPELSATGVPMHTGFARERKAQHPKSRRAKSRASGDTGAEFAHRRGPISMVADFGKGIFWVSSGLFARATLITLRKIGVSYRPAILTNLAGQPDVAHAKSLKSPKQPRRSKTLDFWLLSDDGSLDLPKNIHVDVEAETRRRLQHGGQLNGSSAEAESVVSSHLYQWWRNGGWWGDKDSSGDYEVTPSEIDEDMTSVISAATSTAAPSLDGWQDDDSDSAGRRTPTQDDMLPNRHRCQSTPVPEGNLMLEHLATLLNPETASQSEEAVILSRHLRSRGPMTRSSFNRSVHRDKSLLLADAINTSGSPMTAEDEEQALERFILQRRRDRNPASRQQHRGHSMNFDDDESGAASGAAGRSASWNTGAAGLGSGGPSCVVCHSSPRTILMWPCGCLSLCDDCRIGLATRNFATCVCCRTNVVAYSRLYVP